MLNLCEVFYQLVMSFLFPPHLDKRCAPPSLINAQAVTLTTDFGTTIDIQCIAGFELRPNISMTTSTCLDGAWAPNPVLCDRK